MRRYAPIVRALVAECRWSCAAALLMLCTAALCGAGTDKKPPPDPKAALWFTLSAFGVCAALTIGQIAYGKREAMANWRADRVARKDGAQARERAAALGDTAGKVLSLALAGEWQKAQLLVSTLAEGPHRDTLKVVLDRLNTRDEAARLVPALVIGAGFFAPFGKEKCQGIREGVLLAASELAHFLRVPIHPASCQHPFDEGQGCPTCGEGVCVKGASDAA